MKLRATLALLLCLVAVDAGATSLTTTGAGKPAAAGCSDADATAWQSAVVTAGGTVSGTQYTRVCNLITALKGHGVWSLTDRIWLYASENTQQASVDLVARAIHTVFNSPTFTASVGYTGNGSNAYIDTGINPSSFSGNYTLNSAFHYIYVQTAGLPASFEKVFFVESGPSAGISVSSGGTIASFVNEGGGGSNNTISSTQGSWLGSRTNSTTVALYQNSSASAFATGGTSSSLPNEKYTVFASDGLFNFSTRQISVVALGGGLTSTQASNFSTDINSYMTALGQNVY